MRARGWLVVLALAVTGCADGTSTLVLDVSGPEPTAQVDGLQFTFVDQAHQRTSSQVRIPGASPTSGSVSFYFSKNVRGLVHVEGAAYGPSGTVITGAIDVTMRPSHTTRAAFRLGASGPPPDPARSTVTVDRDHDVVANGADAAKVTVTLLDGDGKPIAGAIVALASSGARGSFSMPLPTDENGVTTAAFTSTLAETKTITATGNGVPLAQMPKVTFIPGGVAQLGFVQAIDSGLTHTPLTAFDVAVQDANGNAITSAANAVTLAFATNPGGANLLGITSVRAVNGVAHFEVVGLDQAGTGYSLRATASNLSDANSSAFNVLQEPFTLVDAGFYGGNVQGIAVSPAPSGGGNPTIWAGTVVGVFKSTDNAATWSRSDFGIQGEADIVAADPNDASVVYTTASFGDGSFGNGNYFVAKTANGGAGWAHVGAGSGQVGALAIDPKNSAIVYAGNFLGVWRSTTGGATWTQTPFGFRCYGLAVDPVITTTVYALATSDMGAYLGVYKSLDSGSNWNPVNANLPATTLSLLATAPGAVFVGVNSALFRSVDGGGSWATVLSANPFALAYAPSSPGTIYVGTGSSVAVSTNSGAGFGTPVSVGKRINALAVDPASPQQVYAATSDGVYVSSNGGGGWGRASTGINVASLNSVALSPTDANRVLIGGPNGIFASSNGGVTFANVSAIAPYHLKFDPATPSRVYACDGSSFYTSTNSGGAFGGGVANGGCYYGQIDPHGATIWVADVGGLHYSGNTGASFVTLTAGLPPSTASYGVIANDSGKLVVGTNQGVYYSANSGGTLGHVSSELVEDFVGAGGDVVVAGLSCGSNGATQSNGGFMRSTDFGATWGAVIPGLCVNTLFSNGTNLYAAGRGLGLGAVSSDGGLTWFPLGYEITGQYEASDIAASTDGKIIYLATTVGLYKSTTGGQ
jgi:hypothetical protein